MGTDEHPGLAAVAGLGSLDDPVRRQLYEYVAAHDEPVSRDALDARLAILAQRTPQPQVDVRADNVTKYGVIAEVVKQVRMAGIRKVGFVSTPER